MTRVKICGITSLDDALWATDRGADAIGFVFAESPRRVSPESAGAIMRGLSRSVTGVGVFVNSDAAEIRRTLEIARCSEAQLHGDEGEELIAALAPYAVVKALPVKGGVDAGLVERYRSAMAILLDTYVGGIRGGTGQRFDLSVASELVKEGWRVIVAGGLTPENVGEVISTVRPYGVDVSTGVERAPGRKDRDKVARFIAAARAADARRC
ncbi:MAG: N-(5'-phosphoribosyl)anthranilate isomerase [Armatimonadota bacterium]